MTQSLLNPQRSPQEVLNPQTGRFRCPATQEVGKNGCVAACGTHCRRRCRQ
jgi:hypothetical protein